MGLHLVGVAQVMLAHAREQRTAISQVNSFVPWHFNRRHARAFDYFLLGNGAQCLPRLLLEQTSEGCRRECNKAINRTPHSDANKFVGETVWPEYFGGNLWADEMRGVEEEPIADGRGSKDERMPIATYRHDGAVWHTTTGTALNGEQSRSRLQ
jgi:hypothetical protein